MCFFKFNVLSLIKRASRIQANYLNLGGQLKDAFRFTTHPGIFFLVSVIRINKEIEQIVNAKASKGKF